MTGAVGKVYSEALFELAAEQNCAEQVFNELESLKAVWRDNPELSKLLCTPTVGIGEKLAAVENIFKGRVSEIVYNFICVITEKNRGASLPDIADSYKDKWYDASGIAEVTVTSCKPLSAVMRDKLVKKLETVYKKKIILTEKVDESLIGGIKVNYGDTMLDGSVKTRLENMQKQISGIIA